MSDTLVKRLRDGAYGADVEAADRIEELEAALRAIAAPLYTGRGNAVTREAIRRQKLARAALDGTPGDPAAETAPS